MRNEKLSKQRKAVESALIKLAGISEEIDSAMVGEKYLRNNDLAYRSLGSRKGHIVHFRNGGFDSEYLDSKGNKYILKYCPKK
jgi:hypothetical protein